MRPGDRRERWESTCNIEGTIMLLIGVFFCYAGITATKGGLIPLLMGITSCLVAFSDFRSAKKGWKITGERPSCADKHDAIDRGNLTLYKRYSKKIWKI